MRTLFTLEEERPPFDTAQVLAVNLPVMSYGRTEQQVQRFLSRSRQRRVSALPGVEQASSGFSVPWRDDQGAEHHVCVCGAGSHEEERAGGFAGELPVSFAGILRDAGRAAGRGTGFSRHG